MKKIIIVLIPLILISCILSFTYIKTNKSFFGTNAINKNLPKEDYDLSISKFYSSAEIGDTSYEIATSMNQVKCTKGSSPGWGQAHVYNTTYGKIKHDSLNKILDFIENYENDNSNEKTSFVSYTFKYDNKEITVKDKESIKYIENNLEIEWEEN